MNDIQKADNLRGKKVLVRIDADVPIEGGVVVNSYRIKAILPTINFLKKEGARIILLGHLGRDGKTSFKVVCDVLRKYVDVEFVPDILGSIARGAIEKMQDGDIILLENIRSEEGEVKNDDILAKNLASLADIYVNESFAVSHRKHASLVGVPKYLPSFAGIQLQREVAELSVARKPQHPSLFILGGMKFETKFPLIKQFVEIYDYVMVAGALANNFFKTKGLEVGYSLTSVEGFDIAGLIENERILLPVDVVIEKNGEKIVKKPDEVQPDENILDAGPETILILKERIAQSRFVLWNGPLGEYERGFAEQTNALAQVIADSDAYTVVGGGDTSAAISLLGLEGKYSFLSTGGGAMLQFLLDGTLPAIDVLR